MSDQSQKTIIHSLKGMSNITFNLMKELSCEFPSIALGFFAIVSFGIYAVATSADITMVIVAMLVAIVSIAHYIRTTNYVEATLTLVIGLLTVFTVAWTRFTALLFSGIFLSYLFAVFAISCIRLSMETEDILMRAAVNLAPEDPKTTCEELRAISNLKNPENYLRPIDRAKAIHYLVLMRVPVKELPGAVSTVGAIRLAYAISLEEALAFYRSVYHIIHVAIENKAAVDWNMVTNFLRACPCLPNELLKIIGATKSLVLSGQVSTQNYFERIQQAIVGGYDGDEVINFIRSGGLSDR